MKISRNKTTTTKIATLRIPCFEQAPNEYVEHVIHVRLCVVCVCVDS